LPAGESAAETYAIDPDHSTVTFRIKHLGITFVSGIFGRAAGAYTFDDRVSGNASIRVRVRVADVDSGNEKRDRHLQSPDFFDAEKFPYITFTSQSIEAVGDNRYAVAGELSLHGVTRPVRVTAVKTGTGMDSTGARRSGFETRFSIKRSDYGMRYLTGLADKVHLTVSVEGVSIKTAEKAREGGGFILRPGRGIE